MRVERTPVPAGHPAVASQTVFPFGVDFQKALLRLLTEDQNLLVALSKYLKPSYFENEVLAWIFHTPAREGKAPFRRDANTAKPQTGRGRAINGD